MLDCVIGFPARLGLELEIRNDDRGIGRLTHIVKSQGCDGGSGKGFHFYAGLSVSTGGAGDQEGFGILGHNGDFCGIERQRVAEGNELRGFFRPHDAGQNRGVEDRAFFILKLTLIHLGNQLASKSDEARRNRRAASGGFFGNINHAGLVGVIEVSELAHEQIVAL